jgi:hypothetical protein
MREIHHLNSQHRQNSSAARINNTLPSPFQNILPAIMSQAVSFDGGTSYEANEPLIVAAGDAEEEEDHRLEENAFFSRFQVLCPALGIYINVTDIRTNDQSHGLVRLCSMV